MKKEDIEKISKILHLEDNENLITVYLTLLNIGNGTLGQISSIVGFDYITTSNILDDLILQGFVKKIGVIPRYYCLEPFLDSLVRSIDNVSNKAILEMVEKRVEKTPLVLIDKVEMFEDYIRQALNHKKDELIKEFSSISDSNNLLDSFIDHTIETVSVTAFDLIKNAEKSGKRVLKDTIKKDIQPLILLLEDIQKKVKKILESSRAIDVEDKELPTDILFGESSVLAMMKDLILRARSNLTILMPKPELQSIILISEQILSKSIKVTITGNLEKIPQSILKRLNPDTSAGSVQLRQSSEVNSWAIIKDNEEILFAPDVSGTELMVGIWLQASMKGLEQLIYQFSTQIRTMASRAQNIQLK
ncbi:MAG: hypothetical protein HeimC3_43240 [Candidatus Heimdallarchaeota archaeon LC_3]|nr:MAG: hypothetical protein HeimC3_43240 [Candidatus Heimdallarchaeota archaeon LC_3]